MASWAPPRHAKPGIILKQPTCQQTQTWNQKHKSSLSRPVPGPCDVFINFLEMLYGIPDEKEAFVNGGYGMIMVVCNCYWYSCLLLWWTSTKL